MLWFQHRADGWNLRGFIRDEMNKHWNANSATNFGVFSSSTKQKWSIMQAIAHDLMPMFLTGRCRQPAFLRIYTECPITAPENRLPNRSGSRGGRLQSGVWLNREIGSSRPFSAGTSRLATRRTRPRQGRWRQPPREAEDDRSGRNCACREPCGGLISTHDHVIPARNRTAASCT